MAYTREQIYEAMRRADAAGDAEAVRALARQLKGPSFEGVKPDDAQGALEHGEQELERKIAHLPPRAQEDARRRYKADTRVRELSGAAEEEPSFLEQAGKSTANIVAGLAKGPAMIPDAFVEAAAGATRLAIGPAYKAGGVLANLIGREDVAERLEAQHQGVDKALSRPATVGGMIEDAYPTPKGMEGSRLAAQFVGGMMVPMGPKATPRATLPKDVPQTEAAKVIGEGARNNIRVLTSDVKPPRTFVGKSAQATGERIPIAGTGGVRAAQQEQRVEAVKGILREFGGDDVVQLFDDTPTALDDVAKSLTAQRSKELTRLTGAKNAVIDKFDDAVPVPNALQAIDDQIARLEAIGTQEVKPVIAKLKDWKQALNGKSLRNIEELRKIMGNAFDDPGLAGVKDTGQKSVNAIYDPLRRDMGAFIRSKGGDAVFTKWSEANQKLAAMAGELNNTALRNVLKTSDMTPENVGKLLFSRNRSDVARLYEGLDEFGKARSQAAVLQKAFDKAISTDTGLSVERFVNNVKALGDTVGVVFKGPDLARVEGLVKVLDATRRAATASAAPPTGVQNTLAVGGLALGQLAGIVGGGIVGGGAGLFARAYESAPVRNALVKVAKAAPGTVAESRALERAAKVMITALGSQRANVEAIATRAVPLRAAAGEGEENQEGQQPAPQP